MCDHYVYVGYAIAVNRLPKQYHNVVGRTSRACRSKTTLTFCFDTAVVAAAAAAPSRSRCISHRSVSGCAPFMNVKQPLSLFRNCSLLTLRGVLTNMSRSFKYPGQNNAPELSKKIPYLLIIYLKKIPFFFIVKNVTFLRHLDFLNSK